MAIGFSICLQAQQNQQVTRDEAVNAALTRLTGSNVSKDRNLRGIVLTEKNDNAGNTVLYEITTDSVSLLLSGSKACYPILAKYKNILSRPTMAGVVWPIRTSTLPSV
jgi:hypothetical protein